MERKVIIGKVYRHFKGTFYRVMGIATHTETGEEMVIYQQVNGDHKVWACPYAKFISEVDHAKYPDVKQRFRFEEAPQLREKKGAVPDMRKENKKISKRR